VIVQGREYRAHLWRDYRYLDQSREEAAEIAFKTLTGVSSNGTQQYNYGHGYTTTQ
jgi:hypothetical protein